MPVKLLATNPFTEPARLEYEPSPSPATRTYRWKRPLGVLPQHLRPSNNQTRGGLVLAGRSNNQARLSDARQLYSMTQVATEHLKSASQQGFREETKSCDLDSYRLGTPSYGVNNNNHTNQKSSSSKTQLPNIKPDEGSRHGFEYRVGRQTYSRTEVLLKLQRRRKHVGRQGGADSTGVADGRLSKDLPGINMRESPPDSREASSITRLTNNSSDSGCYSRESTGAKSRSPPSKGRKVDCSLISKVGQTIDSSVSEVSLYSSTDIQHESNRHKARIGFVEVATPLNRDKDDVEILEDRSASTSSPVVSNDVDSVCEELQKIVLQRSTPQNLICDTACATHYREENNLSQASHISDKDRLVRAMQALQPPVPHVVWPENKYYTPHTVFVYGSPSRLAPMVIPSHSVDCPQCKLYQASSYGDICPPNSPTPWMQKEYGFYPVERHFLSK
ncbi:uncharacterized protein LOC117292167 [Asterias rubens]|uniref:uncharacterized protein LOC117292167 n=1 Tax=Asterias rubens TaxID=7604 RepID=UPI0014553566|nr:uncharacterized protein LOC117292167 [Asterias rubens]